MAKHAKLGPSSAERWMNCPGSVPLSEGLPDTTSEYADEGTAAHFLAARCLTTGSNPIDYSGHEIQLCSTPGGEHYEAFLEDRVNSDEVLNRFFVDSEMVTHVTKYVDDVRRVQVSINGELHVEQSLSIEYLTGEEDAEGTSDAIILGGGFLVDVDLKYGQGVTVSAKDNKQLLMYAAAARNHFGLLHEIKDISTVIHQPRLDNVSEYTYSNDDLDAFEKEVVFAAREVDAAIKAYGTDTFETYLEPSEDACRWCKAKASCPALAKKVADEIDADFEDMSLVKPAEKFPIVEAKLAALDAEGLSKKAKSIELIEMWCKAIRGKVESLLLSGVSVPDFKLVQGKRGNRAWINEADAEETFKSMRLKESEMYSFKLITPTKAEELLKKASPKRWKRVLPLITQSEGQPSVAPASDKREALVITPVGDEMENLTDDLLG